MCVGADVDVGVVGTCLCEGAAGVWGSQFVLPTVMFPLVQGLHSDFCNIFFVI